MLKSKLLKPNFVYGRLRWKKVTSHTFQHYPNLNYKTKRNILKHSQLSGLNLLQDFKSHEKLFKMFTTSFSVDVKDGTSNIQMELTEMQCNTDLREKFMNEGAVELNSEYVEESQFPAIHNSALFTACQVPRIPANNFFRT
jgi:hypothetical protein